MKKLFLILLVICCIGSFCSCAAVEKFSDVELPPVPTAEQILENMEEVQSEIAETEHKHIIVNTECTELQAYDPQQGEELILSFSYETPFVHITGNRLSEDNINEFIAMLNESYYTGDTYGTVYDSGCAPGYNNMLTMAEDNYNYIVNSGIEGSGYELANHRSVNVERCDERLITLLYYDYVNLGGVHGSYAYRGYCFDVQSGEVLSLGEVCEDAEKFKAFLADSVVNKVQSDEELQQRLNGFVDAEGMPSLADAAAALIRDGNWYLDNEGLVVFSDLYEISSYAAGIQEFRWSYDELKGYLKESYMPENVVDTANFIVVPVEELSESSKEIIDMLKVDESGEAIYVVANGSARDVRVASVDYTDHFYETARLWYCSSMQDCAVQLVTNIPEGMPELKISYRDAEGEHNLYLSQSVEDGSLVLVDDSIQAVG